MLLPRLSLSQFALAISNMHMHRLPGLPVLLHRELEPTESARDYFWKKEPVVKRSNFPRNNVNELSCTGPAKFLSEPLQGCVAVLTVELL